MRQTLERVLNDLGRRLAELRHERGWTQQRVADKVGMLMRDYQSIEGGKRPITIRTAVALAQVFDVPMQALFEPPRMRGERTPGRPRLSGDAHVDGRAAEPVGTRRSEGMPVKAAPKRRKKGRR